MAMVLPLNGHNLSDKGKKSGLKWLREQLAIPVGPRPNKKIFGAKGAESKGIWLLAVPLPLLRMIPQLQIPSLCITRSTSFKSSSLPSSEIFPEESSLLTTAPYTSTFSQHKWVLTYFLSSTSLSDSTCLPFKFLKLKSILTLENKYIYHGTASLPVNTLL